MCNVQCTVPVFERGSSTQADLVEPQNREDDATGAVFWRLMLTLQPTRAPLWPIARSPLAIGDRPLSFALRGC